MAVLAHTPLHKGFLTDQGILDYAELVAELTPSDTLSESMIDQHILALQSFERLKAYAEKQGHTLSEFALAWLVARPHVVAVNACLYPEHLESTIRAVEWELDAEGLALVREVRQDRNVQAVALSALRIGSHSRRYYDKR
jgi:aryl-alcohol dehydrogenase-like predicted oxidoreductase